MQGKKLKSRFNLHDLFVDLPFAAESQTEKEEITEGEGDDDDEVLVELDLSDAEVSQNIVAQILRRAADKLDSESITCRRSDNSRSREALRTGL